jgi:hypothetical protein
VLFFAYLTLADLSFSLVPNNRCHREVWVQYRNDDLSTLGDPMGTLGDATMGISGRVLKMDDDNQSLNTAALDNMLDARTTCPTVATRSPFLVDPGECFDVRVPAGKLGVILEEVTQGGGVPVVHGIKRYSPLVGRVMKGDRLCGVDGVDCTGKSANDVARLLQFREDSPSRMLTFSRPSQC